MPKTYARHYRIAAVLQEALAPMLANIVQGHLITLRYISLNNDFSIATVVYSVVGDDRPAVQEKLDGEAKHYRRRLAHHLNMRRTPQLLFRYDEEGLAADAMRKFLDDISSHEPSDD